MEQINSLLAQVQTFFGVLVTFAVVVLGFTVGVMFLRRAGLYGALGIREGLSEDDCRQNRLEYDHAERYHAGGYAPYEYQKSSQEGSDYPSGPSEIRYTPKGEVTTKAEDDRRRGDWSKEV